ncbi:alpha/beta fold hydrolase [Paenibacillus faecis]|uniref:alpha/beta fold hydrolase n=1 Tax=Paenibacillus faecis TaxID=862114 RepID=UPI001FE99EFE|nr:alpha/beta hydrolase [Paenibacillus faecis]
MFYREVGPSRAPLLVFLHGGGVGGWMWEKQVEFFFRDYRCLVPDLPGHGKSESRTFSMSQSAEEILSLIKSKQNGAPITLVGFSLGAQVIVKMLSLDPGLADYAVINSALTRPLTWIQPWIGTSVRMTHGLLRYRAFAKLQAKQLYIDKDMFEQYYEDSLKIGPELLTEILKENMSFAIPDSFKQTRAKVLITVGQGEKKIMMRSAKDLLINLQGSQGVIGRGFGHGFPLARPMLFNETVEAWIQEKRLPNGLLPLV